MTLRITTTRKNRRSLPARLTTPAAGLWCGTDSEAGKFTVCCCTGDPNTGNAGDCSCTEFTWPVPSKPSDPDYGPVILRILRCVEPAARRVDAEMRRAGAGLMIPFTHDEKWAVLSACSLHNDDERRIADAIITARWGA